MWGWHEMLNNVCDYMKINMLEGMKQPVTTIFMYGTLLKQKIEIIKK